MTEEYKRVLKWAESLPDWKKEVYNNDFATSAHAKKLKLKGEENK